MAYANYFTPMDPVTNLERLVATPLADRVLGDAGGDFVVVDFRLGDEVFDAEAGTGVLAPRGTPHAYGNVSGRPARYLLVMTPSIHRLIEELHAPGAGDDPIDYQAIFRRYDSEMLDG